MFELRFVSPPLSFYRSLCLRPHLSEHTVPGPAVLMPGTLRRPHSTVAKAGRAKETSGIKTLFAALCLVLSLQAGERVWKHM